MHLKSANYIKKIIVAVLGFSLFLTIVYFTSPYPRGAVMPLGWKYATTAPSESCSEIDAVYDNGWPLLYEQDAGDCAGEFNHLAFVLDIALPVAGFISLVLLIFPGVKYGSKWVVSHA